ncbi:DUF3604 domain-containing protein [Candidatus Similichlamydia laticola]|uniref:DUF3604 domain-containing protein n=1 Tax=Candidatus Similichlamydia laticola TaxID=2170265 RepID=A0A369KDA1_9BACT|nr:DUF3604 domain-containing protein [Candidatus Similichlamydia laticola]RDB31582.1 hypothetical protein HAT2_00311 [Candidatus Similichlamydia laticola]
MRRSTVSADFGSCLAGETGCWKFSVCPSSPLQKGTLIRLEMGSAGQAYEWQIPQTNVAKDNAIFGVFNGSTIVKAKEGPLGEAQTISFEFILPKTLAVGQRFQIVIGGKTDDFQSRVGTNRVQTFTQRRKLFLIVMEHAESGLKEQEKIAVDVLGNVLDKIRVLAPSCVGKGKRFDVVVRFEDQFGNPTNNAPPDTLISLSYENLRDNLQWQLFVHETGFVTLPNLYFNEVGVYRIRLKNELNGTVFVSAPIRCFPEETLLFWGHLRGEPPKSKTMETYEMYLRQFRDEMGLNFLTITPPDQLTDGGCIKSLVQSIEDFNEEDRFVTFFGAQHSGKAKEVGCRQLFSTSDSRLHQKDIEFKTHADLKKFYKTAMTGDVIAVPFLTMGEKTGYDFRDLSKEFEHVVEIYCNLGSSECLEDNLFPIRSKSSKMAQGNSYGSVREALNRNLRFGFCAGGIDPRSLGAEQSSYSPGLTAVFSPEFNRKSIFEAISQRSCFATTGARILLGFFVAGARMGQEISTDDKPGLILNRHLTGFVSGLAGLKSVEIIRNGTVLHKLDCPSGQTDLDFSLDDRDDLESISLNHQNKLFSYYYLRIVQEDNHAAWSSPIWVDFVTPSDAQQEDTPIVAQKKHTTKRKRSS